MKTENWVYEQREIWVEGTNTRIAKVTGKDKRPIGYLISASPELLGALQNIIDAHENDDTKQYGILIEQGKSAIKKALNLA